MKKHITTFFLVIFAIGFSQNKKIYLEIDDLSRIEYNKGNNLGVCNYEITIKNAKNESIDNYKFIANLDSSKSFIENGIECTTDKKVILTLNDLKKMNPCNVHDLFSSAQLIFFKKDNEDKKTKCWFFMYLGTSRNISYTRSGKL